MQFVFALKYGTLPITMVSAGALGLIFPAIFFATFLITPHLVTGALAFAILPVALETSVEATYPVNEGTSAGFLWVAV